MIKIIAISDTHLKEMPLANSDILIHCGDALLRGDLSEMAKFAKWWNALPHKHKIFVPGNHDWFFQRQESLARLMLSNTHVLIDETIELEGLKIHGTPRTPEFCGWAFMHEDDSSGLKHYFDLIPNDLDILIAHGPPRGKLDSAPSDPKGVGSIELLAAIERAKPKRVLVGHIHCGREQGPFMDGVEQYGNTAIINCSVVNEQYKEAYGARCFDL